MGTPKKKAPDAAVIRRAHKMAEAFAKAKTDEFSKALLVDSELAETLYKQVYLETMAVEEHEALTFEKYLEHMVNDVHHIMGKLVAICYALGYADAAEKKAITTLYVPSEPKVQTTADPQLILPGVLD